MDYTNDEIGETLSEMGYAAEDDAIEEIRRELLSDDVFDDDSILNEISLLNILNDDYNPPPQETYDDYPHIQELINAGHRKSRCFYSETYRKGIGTCVFCGHQALQSLYEEIDDIDREIHAALDDCDPELRETLIRNLNLRNEAAKNNYHFSETLSDINEDEEEEPTPRNVQNKPQHSKDKSMPKKARFQPTQTLPGFEFDDENQPITLDRNVEQALISEVLKQKGAVRVNCPPPGKAPFKYDPVKRNAQYQAAWKKYPAPGEKRRASLRWKIRDIMTKRDIPHLKLIPNPGFTPRPDWTD